MNYTGAELFQLPNLDSHGVLALGAALDAAAAAQKKLPPAIAKARTRMAEAMDALRQVTTGRLQASPGTPHRPGGDAGEADLREDGAWAALYFLLQAWSRLPGEHPESARAHDLLGALFPNKLDFTRLPYREEWSEAKSRLERMAQEKADQALAAMGAKVFLDELKAAHEAYGEAIGVTRAKAPEAADAGSLRDAREAAVAAVKTYAVKVVANVDEDEPATAKLADGLLAPIVALPRRAAPARGKGGKGAPPAPAQGSGG